MVRISKNPPDDIDEAFVLNHFQNSTDDFFAFVASTKRLLQNSVGKQNICSDGTYSIVWQGFPIIDIGFIDRDNHYHLTALCLTRRERTVEYEFVFNAIQTAVHKLFASEFCPNVLVSDAGSSIRNAFYSSFESAKQNVICYIHVQRNISKFKYRSMDNKESIMTHHLRFFKKLQAKVNLIKQLICFWLNGNRLSPNFARIFNLNGYRMIQRMVCWLFTVCAKS